ncbi:MAG TPA: SRPBCC family protein [Myxococcota bacterium]|jgi:uncharacterized protein YndB with AHSA1/START domain|nr:SRPBCC family protein [Myxococcota bacterium]
MITVALSTAIRADRSRIWRALTDPVEIAGWDAPNGNAGALDLPPEYPKPGQHVRWRYRQGGVPIVLHERPIEVVAHERLRALLELGPLRFDATFDLLPDPGHPERTRLQQKLVASNAVAVVGGVIDRFEMRALATGRVSRTLEAIRARCEGDA